MSLSAKYRQQLKAQAHALKPVVMVGNNGLTEAIQNEIEQALTAHELIKIRIASEDREIRSKIIAEICQARQAELIQIIGSISIIYRKNIKPEK